MFKDRLEFGRTLQGDFFVRSGPGTVKLAPESAADYIRSRFQSVEPMNRTS
jgi:hypothetical protein